jgi:hypothetical protein
MVMNSMQTDRRDADKSGPKRRADLQAKVGIHGLLKYEAAPGADTSR